MKHLLYSIVIILAFEVILSNCANPKTPTGGPQDTIPPTMVNAIPANGALNVNVQEIEIEFDEWITAEKLSQNLIITPQLDIKYKTIVKKNKLILKFETPFPDSTTITLNFFDGIADITEKTPAVNLSYVFSTGDYLDSLTISGKVTDLFTQETIEKLTVGIYPYTDTLNFFKSKPTYFTSTSKEGLFKISNIKNGKYKLVAFKDDNRNLLFDAAQEIYGFKNGVIQLDTSLTDINLTTVKINASELKKLSSKTNGKYFDTRYSKPIDSLTTNSKLPYHILSDLTTVRYYQNESYIPGDSIFTITTVYDSLANSNTDTLYIKFNESIRKPANFDLAIIPNNKSINIQHSYNIHFTKPVIRTELSQISWKLDSIYRLDMDSTFDIQWNQSKTQLSFTHTFDTATYYQLQRSLIKQADSLQNDSTKISRDKKDLDKTAKRKLNKATVFTIDKGAFISSEYDTIKAFSQTLSFVEKQETGTIILNLTTSVSHYTVQLINKQFKVIQEFTPFSTKRIVNLPAGDYGIRILIDSNKDGIWSYGNILKDIEPEQIFLYPDFTSLRANWEVSLDISF